MLSEMERETMNIAQSGNSQKAPAKASLGRQALVSLGATIKEGLGEHGVGGAVPPNPLQLERERCGYRKCCIREKSSRLSGRVLGLQSVEGYLEPSPSPPHPCKTLIQNDKRVRNKI